MKKKAIVLVGTTILAGVSVGTPFLTAGTLTAHAAVFDLNINQQTSLSSDYLKPISGLNGNPGNFTLSNSALAELELAFKGDKTANITIPESLIGHVATTGDAKINVTMLLDLSKIPAINNFLTTADTTLSNLADFASKQNIAGLGLDFSGVYKALDLVGTLRNLTVTNTSAPITLSDDGRTLSTNFDDATILKIANDIMGIVHNLQNALNAINFTGTNPTTQGIASVLNLILSPIKSAITTVINTTIDGVTAGVGSTILNNVDSIGVLLNYVTDISVLKSNVTVFPVSINVDKSWYQTNAPAGGSLTFTGMVAEQSNFDSDLSANYGQNTTTLKVADIIAPDMPVLLAATTSKVEADAEAGSTTKVYDGNKLVGSEKVAGIEDGVTPNEVSISLQGVKAGDKLTVVAVDEAGNVSEKATATTPLLSEKAAQNAQAVYRAYNPNSGEHLYTTSRYEYRQDVAKGWKAEGIDWYAPKSGQAVYRLYNPNSGEHFYTTSSYEYNQVAAKGWNKEGVAFYSANNKKVPVYRAFNPNAKGAGSHFYTTSAFEYNSVAAQGWNKEAVAFYGVAK